VVTRSQDGLVHRCSSSDVDPADPEKRIGCGARGPELVIGEAGFLCDRHAKEAEDGK